MPKGPTDDKMALLFVGGGAPRHDAGVTVDGCYRRGTDVISQTAEYALRAMVTVAQQPDQAHTTQQIAKAAHLRAPYLSKVLNALGRAGMVEAQRGVHGGFTLARPADELTVLEVINVVDPVKRVRRCPLGLPEHEGRLCALHRRLDAAASEVEKAFAETTIAQLLRDAMPFAAADAAKQ